MKQILLVVICLSSLSLCLFAQAPETYDITTFRSAKGWSKQAGQNSVLFSTEDKAKGSYCLVNLFKSLPGIGNPKENFDAAWKTLVVEAVTVSSAPQMFPSDNKEDWKVEGGYATFTKENEKGVVVLYTASGYGKMVNILVLTNTMDYEPAITAFLESFSFKKPEGANAAPAPASAPDATPIVGTWGQNLGAHMSYGDPVAAGIAGYSKDQYTFNADGTYTFVSKTFRMSYDKIILVIENGTYQINGDTIAIKPQKSVIQAWSKLNGVDKWGRLLSSQPRKLEAVTYKFTKHYFSGIDEWNLVLQAEQPTERDGPFSTLKLFPNAWYYKAISANNPVVELPR